MGYSYCARTGRLACDNCGASDGKTRKRTCPYKVAAAEGFSLPYCYPAALCPACYALRKATLHKDCAAGAAARTAEEAHKRARLEAGEFYVAAAWGDWHAAVPQGFVGVLFRGINRMEAKRLVPTEEYNRRDGTRGLWLSDYPNAQPWGARI